MNVGRKLKNLVSRVRRKFFRPKVMRKKVSEGIAQPRLRKAIEENINTRPLIYRIKSGDDLARVSSSLEILLKKQYLKLIENRRVMIKYNLNTANPYPASVDPQMLRTLVDLLLKLGATEISVGDCCTVSLIPTRNQVKKAGLPQAIGGRAKLICFDELSWVTVPIEAEHLKSVTVPRVARDAETIISLANLKTHYHAVFTGALKLAVGFMHPLERYALHRDHLQEKIAELNLALQSDLYIMDARTVMITGGPDHGKTANAGTILVSDNPLALDIEAYRLLYRLKAEHGCLEGFMDDPFSLTQLRHARDIGIGGSPWHDYAVEAE